MQALSVGIIGASGYSGVEATRILAFHPRIRVSLMTSDRWAGASLEAKTGLRVPGIAPYAPFEKSRELCKGLDAALLCTPAEVSLELAPKLLEAGVRFVIDLSGAFRLLDVAAYKPVYGFEHSHPALLGSAVYGMPE